MLLRESDFQDSLQSWESAGLESLQMAFPENNIVGPSGKHRLSELTEH